MSYNTDINWDLFFTEELKYDDKPIYIKNFLPKVEKYVNWDIIQHILNNTNLSWRFINNRNFPEIPLVQYFDKSIAQNKTAIQHYINEGYTFIIDGYDIYNEYIKSLCLEIEARTDAFAKIKIFGSKNTQFTNSYPPHLDETPLLIFQTAGKAEWNLYSNRTSNLYERETINQNLDYTRLTQSHQFLLSPGDFLYVPQRYFHKVKDFKKEPYRLSLHIAPFLLEEGIKFDKNYYNI